MYLFKLLELLPYFKLKVFPVIPLTISTDDRAMCEKISRWFSEHSAQDQQNHIQSRQPLGESTAEWLFQSEEAASEMFRKWRDQASESIHDRLLWAFGHPAVGKTAVVSQVIEHLRRNFCSSRTSLRRTGITWSYINELKTCATAEQHSIPQVLLLSLTRTLLEQLPEIPASSKQFFEANRLRESKLLDVPQIFGHLKKLCKLMFDDVYIIVDGLDEVGEKEMRHIINYLKELPVNARTMFVSRYMESIQDAIGTPMKLHIEAHEPDVRIYFAKEVEGNIDFAALVDEAERIKPGQRVKIVDALFRQAKFS